MSQAVITAVLLVAGIGLIAGIILAVASTVFAVKVNEKEVLVRDCLPGANCGACGYSGCDGYAKALADGKETNTGLCRPGGSDAALKISKIMGLEVTASEPMVAFIHCKGDCEKCKEKAETEGLMTCKSRKSLYGGAKACAYGCLGCGDCKAVCPADAICIEKGIAHIDPRKCIACGMCVKTCPNGIISLIPKKPLAVVACSNKDKGAITRKACTAGCIGCMKCQRSCPYGAVTVTDNVASVDYSKCTGCGTCAEGCPVHCIDIHKI